jgi:hypothetical protein
MPRKYTGNTDAKKGGSTRPGLKKFMDLAMKRWGFTNLGAYNYRMMNNPKAKADPNNPKWLSVHATGRACDLGYKNRQAAEQAWEWILANAAALGVEEIHDYAFDPDGAGPGKPWGRGFRCSRGEGKAGVKIYNEKENAGTPGGKWLHFELSPDMADNPAKLEAAWNAIPAPGNVATTPKQIIKPNPAKAPNTGRPDNFPGDLKVGSKGDNVKAVQKKIGATADGDFGPKTKGSVADWQKKNGLKATGVVNAETWRKMFA